jgi:8-oxo-dGTP pyrophosphatase MutT (NUDIX family)
MKLDFALYQVALKLLLKKGGKVLFLRTSDDGKWDIPGGRIDNVEVRVPLKKILAREVKEELGPDVRYRVGKPLFQFRSYVSFQKIYCFKTVYEGMYVSAKIILSPEHTTYEWIDPKIYRWNGKDFSSEEECRAFTDYFKNHA